MSYSSIPLTDPRCLSLGRYPDPGEVDDTDCCEYCGEPMDGNSFDDEQVCDNCRMRKVDFWDWPDED